MQRTANPCMPVRFRPRPPKYNSRLSGILFWKFGAIEPARFAYESVFASICKMRRENHTSGESSCVSNGRRVRRCELSDDTPPKYNSCLSGILFWTLVLSNRPGSHTSQFLPAFVKCAAKTIRVVSQVASATVAACGDANFPTTRLQN